MATYNLYTNIDENRLKNDAANLKEKASQKENELKAYIDSVSGIDWIASAKSNFFNALNDINKLLNTLNSQLSTLETHANNIRIYKDNEKNALTNKQNIDNLRNQLYNNIDEAAKSAIRSNINDIKQALNDNETQMEECQRAIGGGRL